MIKKRLIRSEIVGVVLSLIVTVQCIDRCLIAAEHPQELVLSCLTEPFDVDALPPFHSSVILPLSCNDK